MPKCILIVDDSSAVRKTVHSFLLLPDIVTIADEVDAQLRQQMHCYKAANVAKMAKAN